MPAKVVHYSEVREEAVPDLEGVTVRWVISKDDGAPHFAMRVFELQPGCRTPQHAHWWEHEVFVLEGQGWLWTEEGEYRVQAGTVAYVPGDLEHQFRNQGEGVLRFICLVPHPELEGWAN
ncbi:MAG: cupin domain-containing protein [Chloroflexia bacterium]|nr:cupin domain-containing protein [Chloroflexia bacterium]